MQAKLYLHVFLLTCILLADVATAQEPKSTSDPSAAGSPKGASKIEFASVSEALEKVAERVGARKEIVQGGWTIIHQYRPDVVWSFAPPSHAAYPAVVKRVLTSGDDGFIRMEMSMLCEASKAPCDGLYAEFQQLNERAVAAAREAVNRRQKTQQ
jgi:hypothetical protein